MHGILIIVKLNPSVESSQESLSDTIVFTYCAIRSCISYVYIDATNIYTFFVVTEERKGREIDRHACRWLVNAFEIT